MPSALLRQDFCPSPRRPPARRRRARGVRLGWTLATLILVGCTAPSPVDDFRTLQDREVDPARRLAALDRLGPIGAWPEGVDAIAALNAIAWSDRHPDELRIVALDRLADYDEASFKSALRRRLSQVESWPVLKHAFSLIASRAWRDLTPVVIRSWGRRSQIYADPERPEREVVARLHSNQPVEEVVAEVFVGLDDGTAVEERVAAWTLLNRLLGPDQARAILASVPPATPTIVDLQAADAVLDVLPRDAEGLLWLSSLRRNDDGARWEEATHVVAQLSPEQRLGLELRHLPTLMTLAPAQRLVPRESLLISLRDRLGRVPHVARVERDALPGAASEAFTDHAEKLSWGDLATISLILDAMEDRELVAQWFVQADADQLDTRTEFGGVLVRRNGAWLARGFRPTLHAHDRKFYSSASLIEAMYRGVAHYHFHAQKHDNTAFAGPGAGDLQFVENLRPNALVLTFLDRDTLNVDYYAPGGVVVDLGHVYRSRPRG